MKMLLWEKRNEKGYSIRQLEELSGVSKSTINKLENNYIPKSLEELEQLAKALKCSISDLYEE